MRQSPAVTEFWLTTWSGVKLKSGVYYIGTGCTELRTKDATCLPSAGGHARTLVTRAALDRGRGARNVACHSDVTELALQALQDAGVPLLLAAQCTILLRHFVVGFYIEE